MIRAYNKRMRKLSANFVSALSMKESRAERDEAFQAEHAAAYAAFGKTVRELDKKQFKRKANGQFSIGGIVQ